MSKDFADYGYDKPIDKMYGGAVGDTDIVVTTSDPIQNAEIILRWFWCSVW